MDVGVGSIVLAFLPFDRWMSHSFRASTAKYLSGYTLMSYVLFTVTSLPCLTPSK